MAKRLVYIFSVIVWLSSALTSAQSEPTELYVFAPTLALQASPGSDQENIGTLTYGDRVQIAAHTDAAAQDWIKVQIETKAGHVEAYAKVETLLPVPAPDIVRTGFPSLLDHLAPHPEESVTKTDDTTTVVQAYSHGVTLVTRTFHTPYGEFSEQQISVSGLNVRQGFLIARAIVNQDGPTSDHMTRTAKIETDEAGNPFIFDESHWQMISVTQAPDGVTISFPERAD